MKSVMAHSFSQVPRADIPRSTFNRSHGYKATFDADYLIPVFVDPVVPGDTFNLNMHFFARLATPLYPIMDNMYLESFFFFVPNRLVWDNWEKFCGAQDDPGDSIDYTIPVASRADSGGCVTGSLWDYFGLPIGATPDDHTVSALPWRGYMLIWDEWFRDQNLQDSLINGVFTSGMDDGPDTITDARGTNNIRINPLKRGKRHDYFTSCLPWPQKGDAVDLPLGTSAPVSPQGDPETFEVEHAGANAAGLYLEADGNVRYNSSGSGYTPAFLEWHQASDYLEADLSTATAATINELRLAFQTQRLLERDARSGTRYNETILAHYGVTVPDFRIQRPEFLGGGTSPVNISQVTNNSGSSGDLGDLAAFGTVSGNHGFTKSFTEHGYIIGLVNVRSDISYSQGIDRFWSWQTRYEHYYPVLSQIGEQAVENREIWVSGSSVDDDVFGYQERYAELRYKNSKLAGKMKPDASGTLAAWHLSEDFASLPTLGSTFIESNTGTPLDRAIAVPTEPHFIFDAYFDLKCARPMPLYGVPGNLDHF